MSKESQTSPSTDKEQNDLTFRVTVEHLDGSVADAGDFGLEDFGGIAPAIGDEILDPFAGEKAVRYDPQSRAIWRVKRRVFNPRDHKDYIALLVEERLGDEGDRFFIG
jgi:hypothetical protein